MADELEVLSHQLVQAARDHDSAGLDELLADEFTLDGAAPARGSSGETR